jgi:cell division GTPase FtsZ
MKKRKRFLQLEERVTSLQNRLDDLVMAHNNSLQQIHKKFQTMEKYMDSDTTKKAIIQIMSNASGEPCLIENQFLKSCDFEAYDGRGLVIFTKNKDNAMKFDNIEAAHEFVHTIPKSKPTRADGQPHRPLTAYKVQILWI